MYTPYRDERIVKLNIPWDTNTARGFGLSMLLNLLLLLLASTIEVKPPSVYQPQISRIPLELLSFGDGDGTGVSKGNLSREGLAHQAPQPPTNLHDASVPGRTVFDRNAANLDPELASSFIPRSEISSDERNQNLEGTGRRNYGSPDGSLGGTGLGTSGSGPGLGYGMGDIEWGGGGNRIVLQKKIPDYPKGANTSGQIRIRFVVAADGTVISMRPAQKGGDPALERAAMDALRVWRFNPLKEDKDMEGIITFTFRLS